MGNFDILAQRLKTLRSEMKLTQKDFAKKIGFTQATLSAYENNQKKPSLDIIKEIAEKCNVSIDWLCGLSEKKNYNTEAETYGDAIGILNDAWQALHFKVIEESPYYIGIYDSVMQYFLKDWLKMLDLYADGTIDKKLYDLWLEDKKKVYNQVRLNSEEDIIDFLAWMSTEEPPAE